eukprot:TRINITY_DN33808_c0_g1_i1.p1 TRINITY_DN33808_c0_g1~~TRINITY_DN33808_c0_g1_i1.p1  ORF type:complete len:144 (-),score=10.23 TRINITY_DN33808_c0_g1_i1:368-799(-)
MMRRTAFAIGMHGAAMFQTTFLPVGSHLLELVPFKCSSISFQRIGRSLGVAHEVWLDTHFETTRYDNDCFDNSWLNLTEFDCKLRFRQCFNCVKDHPITRVSLSEVGPIIESMLPGIRAWLIERQAEMWEEIEQRSLEGSRDK